MGPSFSDGRGGSFRSTNPADSYGHQEREQRRRSNEVGRSSREALPTRGCTSSSLGKAERISLRKTVRGSRHPSAAASRWSKIGPIDRPRQHVCKHDCQLIPKVGKSFRAVAPSSSLSHTPADRAWQRANWHSGRARLRIDRTASPKWVFVVRALGTLNPSEDGQRLCAATVGDAASLVLEKHDNILI